MSRVCVQLRVELGEVIDLLLLVEEYLEVI